VPGFPFPSVPTASAGDSDAGRALRRAGGAMRSGVHDRALCKVTLGSERGAARPAIRERRVPPPACGRALSRSADQVRRSLDYADDADVRRPDPRLCNRPEASVRMRAAALLVVRQSSRGADATASGVMQASESAAADDCFARPRVARPTSAMAKRDSSAFPRERWRVDDCIGPISSVWLPRSARSLHVPGLLVALSRRRRRGSSGEGRCGVSGDDRAGSPRLARLTATALRAVERA
jgi:hypothetical protein